jgi:rhamnose utilization protein RhaD (predicted bifunctional aldolase and dehydrogenase)
VLILGNHGLVVGAANCDEAEALVVEVEQRLALTPRNATRAVDSALAQSCARTKYRPAQDAPCQQLATDPYNLAISTRGSLYPDHAVFLGPALPVLAEGEDLAALAARFAAEGSPPPAAVLVPGRGTAICTNASAGAASTADVLGARGHSTATRRCD